MAIIKCEHCGEEEIPNSATFCPSCGKSIAEPIREKDSTPLFGTKTSTDNSLPIPLPQILGLAGSVILFIGVFTPIISLPIVGGMNYFQNGRGDGVIVLLVAILSGFLTLAKRYRFLLFTGGGSLAILALTFIVFQVRMSQMQAEMKKSMGNNPFAGLGDAMMNSVQISWGWAVLIIGAVLLIAAALVKKDDSDKPETASNVFSSIADKHIFAAIGAVFVIWLGLVFWGFVASPSSGNPNAVSLGQGPKGATTAKSVVDQPLLIEFLDKSFTPSDIYNGRYEETIDLTISFINKTDKDIRAFDGTLEFTDLLDNKILSSKVEINQSLAQGAAYKWDGSLRFNQFMPPHVRLKSEPKENLKVSFRANKVLFADNTSKTYE